MKSNTPIPYNKYHPAHLPDDLVARPRLLVALTNGLERKARLYLLTAAAGYGKTSLVHAWLQQIGIDHHWFNLDSGDDDPDNFAYLVSQRADGAIPESAHASEPKGAVDRILQSVHHSGKTTLLIFDRFESIRSRAVLNLLENLLEQLPPQYGIVLISRKNPALAVSRLRASNQLVELDEGDLRFNLNETRSFIERKNNNQPIPPENLEILQQKTQGWVAGLRLAIDQLGSPLPNDAGSLSARLNGALRFMSAYFEEEVFSKENAALQEFMVKTAALDSFCAPLCAAVIHSRNAQNHIDTLIGNHLFCFPNQEQPGWCGYHPLFREFLDAKCDPQEKQMTFWRTSRWFQQQGLLREAVAYGLRSGDESSALEIIEPACEHAILEGDLTSLADWLGKWSGNGFQSRPELLVYQGWIDALKGDFVQAQVLTERAEDLIRTVSRAKKRDEAGPLQVTLGKLAALRAFIQVMYAHHYDSALKEAKIAQKLLPKNRSAWNLMALWAQAETQKRIDHIGKSIETLYEALRIGRSVGGKTFTYAIINSLAAALFFNGRRGEALDLCQKAVARSSDAADPALGGIHAWIARLNFEANRLDAAYESIEKALALNDQAGVGLNQIFCHYYASQIYQAGGEPGRALESIKRAQSLAGSATLSDESWLNAWEANLNLLQGNLLQVEHWARREGPALTQKPDYLNMEMMLVYTRYLIRTEDFNEAARRLREMEKQAARRGYYRWLLTIELLQAVIWDHNGKKQQALECLKRAIHIAAPEEYQRAFLDENPQVLKLLPELSAESPAFIMRLLRSASAVSGERKKIPTSILPEPLSEREIEILKMLVQGRKGPQISADLFIAYSTVRTHIKSIHRKLDVHTRHELIEKARLLELV